MGRVIISHLAPAQESEIRMLLDLAEAFRRRGHQPIIWSAVYDRRFAPYYLPLNWRLKELPGYYASLAARDVPGIDLDKWRARVEVLIKQEWSGTDRGELFQNLVSMSAQVVETFKPDVILGWNTLCPHTGIACDLNRAAGRQAWLIEKAVFPDTWFVESGGLVGHSVLAGVPLDSLIAPEELKEYSALGREYLERTNFGTYNRYAQTQTSALMEQLTTGPLSERRPRVAFFPPDDGTLGFVPMDGEDRRATVPHHADSFEAAKALSHAHGGITVYKVHPSLAGQAHDTAGCPDLYVSDYDFRKVIAWADVVATTGSGLEFVAMAMGKPVVLLGNDILAGKGIAYEGQSPELLAEAVERAQAREGFEERLARFHAYCGWLVSSYLLSPTAAEGPCRTPDDVAEQLGRECLGGDAGDESENDFWQARAAMLTPKWREKLAIETAEEVALRDKPRTVLITERNETLEAVQACSEDIVLDFDNTLILQNSTERWLDVIRPKTLAFLVVMCCDVFVGFCARRGWCKADRWRDQVRVAVTTVLFPWAYVWWRISAKRRMGRYLNSALATAVASSATREVTIVTFGFRHIVGPLVAQLPFKVRLIASSAFSSKDNLRKRGKVDALAKAIGAERLRSALFVTDSRDDQEVIDHAGRAALLQWAPYPSPAFARTYVPMRYAVQGKYAGRKYFKTQILQEDLAIWLLAYNWSFTSLPTLLCLFMGMYCIYEIGYWQNDHVAAKKEAKPTLSARVARFSNYPIRWGLLWSGAFIALAVALTPFRKNMPLTETYMDLAAAVAMLGLLLVSFRMFNSLPVARRVYAFPILHFVKNFFGMTMLTLNPIGLILLLSQLLSQMMVYVVHRSGGNPGGFNRQAQRALIFITLIITFSLATPWDLAFAGQEFLGHAPWWGKPVYSSIPFLQIALILLWMAFRVVQRAYGKGIVGILSATARGMSRRGHGEVK